MPSTIPGEVALDVRMLISALVVKDHDLVRVAGDQVLGRCITADGAGPVVSLLAGLVSIAVHAVAVSEGCEVGMALESLWAALDDAAD